MKQYFKIGTLALISLAMFGAGCASINTPEDPALIAQRTTTAKQLETRPEARIVFESQVDTFRVTRENKEDVLYLSKGFGKWYRGPLTCFGIGDPQSAISLATKTDGMGIDKFSRFFLLGGGGRNECFVSSLKELSPQETVIFGLETQKAVDARLAKKLPK
jgi:hypothetical protein